MPSRVNSTTGVGRSVSVTNADFFLPYPLVWMCSVACLVPGSWDLRGVIVPDDGTKPAKESHLVWRMPAYKGTDRG